MWIRLLRPHSCFYPPRIELVGSIVSIGSPRGAALIAAGIPEPAVEPPDIGADENRGAGIENNIGVSALVAALGSRARGKIARKC
jgi:hypothetical protein